MRPYIYTLAFGVLFMATLSLADTESPQSGPNGYFQVGTDFDIGLNGGPTEPTHRHDARGADAG